MARRHWLIIALILLAILFVVQPWRPMYMGYYCGESPMWRWKLAIYQGEYGIEGEGYENGHSLHRIPGSGIAHYLGLQPPPCPTTIRREGE